MTARYLDTALERMKTGVRVTYKNGKWRILSNPHGLGEVCWGAYKTPEIACTMYLLTCSLADLPPSEHLYTPGHTGSGWP